MSSFLGFTTLTGLAAILIHPLSKNSEIARLPQVRSTADRLRHYVPRKDILSLSPCLEHAKDLRQTMQDEIEPSDSSQSIWVVLDLQFEKRFHYLSSVIILEFVIHFSLTLYSRITIMSPKPEYCVCTTTYLSEIVS